VLWCLSYLFSSTHISGLRLLNSGYKIDANIIKNKSSRHYQSILGEEQNDFHKCQSCSDGYFTIKILLEKHQEYNVETHIAFVDLKKIINRVNRTKLLEFLQNDKIPNRLYKTNLIFG
jgi:hypothetical protein